MKTHTSGLKTALKTFGREIDVIINYGDDDVLTNENINSIQPYFNTEFFKTVMRGIKFNSNVKIPTLSWISLELGIKVAEEYEYLDFGSYYLNDKEPEYNIDTKSYTYNGYSKMIESMIYYDEDPLTITYPITYGNLIIAIATKLGWTFTQTGFINENVIINNDLYSGLGLTYRDILDDLCPASMGNFVVSDAGVLSIKYPTITNDTITDDYLKEENINIGEKVGPINSLVLSRSEDGDTIFEKDDESIAENGLNEIKIKDNLLLSSIDRDNFITDMFTYINGYEYYSFDISSTGICYYDELDNFTINHNNINYNTVLLNDEITIENGLKEQLYSPKVEESTTNYETSSASDKSKKMATIIAYKNKARIELLATETEGNSSNIASLQITTDAISSSVTAIESDISTIETSITTIDGTINQIKVSGGSNLLRNTDLVETSGTDYLYWTGSLSRQTNINAKNGIDILLQNDTASQEITLANGNYIIGFNYERLIALSIASVSINGATTTLGESGTYELSFTISTNSLEVIFTCDTDNGYAIRDLMANAGSVLLPYSNNQNEIRSEYVTIGRGIEIRSDTKNTINKLDADGMRVLNASTLEEVQTSTDEGGEFKKIVARENSTIAGLSINKVGTHVQINGVL